ncbi:coatomer [Striga asiatica]|uniref:Coatomer n=1 Tax=Striga asiatica TaxID=4170 RepID=A0A5A7PLY1_STRAF|nr:coatomer [Striga asiatica]
MSIADLAEPTITTFFPLINSAALELSMEAKSIECNTVPENTLGPNPGENSGESDATCPWTQKLCPSHPTAPNVVYPQQAHHNLRSSLWNRSLCTAEAGNAEHKSLDSAAAEYCEGKCLPKTAMGNLRTRSSVWELEA